MRVLALDTTTQPGSVALVDGARVIAERSGEPSRTHAERLPRDIIALLEETRVPMSGIDLFAVACGPGSFTGLRIGIATIQGLAFATDRRIVGVSALEALAQIASRGAGAGTIVGSWMDAHRREVFSSLYRVTGAAEFEPDRLVEIEAAAVGDPAATLSRWGATVKKNGWRLIGDGVIAHRDVIARSAPSGTTATGAPAIAGAIGRLAVARAHRGDTIVPAAIRPLYVRRPDAEIARDT